MEYIVEKTNKKIKLNEELKSSVAKIVCNNFKTYNDARSSNLIYAREIIKEVFLKPAKVSKKNGNKSNWRSDIKMCKHYMFFKTLKSFV